MTKSSCTTCGNPGEEVQLIETPDGEMMCVYCLNGQINFEEVDGDG